MKTEKLNTPEGMWPNMKSEATKTDLNTNKVNQQNTTQTNEFNNKAMNPNCKPNQKVISKSMTIASGSAAGTYEKEALFGNEYKRCLGYYFILVGNGGLTNNQIKIGISDGTRTVLEKTHIDHHTATTAVPIKDRFNREECIDLPAGKLIAQIETAAATVSTFEVQMIAIVTRD